MARSRILYRTFANAANLILPLAARAWPKLEAGDAGRRSAIGRWEAWGRANRDLARPLLWIHAPSVGEGLQAQAVLDWLRPRHPDWQIGYSYFSPSAAALGRNQPVDVADFLPYDTAENAKRLLVALRPTALVFTKLDLWPTLAVTAKARGARVGMIAATVSPVSGRLRPAARWLTRPGYRALDAVGAISAVDAERLERLGVAPSRIRITGDPRFDSATERARGATQPALPNNLTSDRTILVAGSTWPEDERVLVPAFTECRRRDPNLLLIIAPHEPTPTHLKGLERQLRLEGIRSERLSAIGADGNRLPEAIVVDRLGVLAGLYSVASVAYVGGGFGHAGLHSVLEPAAYGVPTIVGPHWRSSREAGLLLEVGGLRSIAAESRQGATAELRDALGEWLGDAAARRNAGRQALDLVDRELGAARKNGELIETLLEDRR